MVRGALRDLDRVLADTMVFCNVLRALTPTALIDVLDYMHTTLAIVSDVHREMDGLSRGPFPGLQDLKTVELVGHYLRGPALPLAPDLVADVELIVEHSGFFTRSADDAAKKNWGEVATILAASRLRVPVLMDDREGQRFARQRGVDVLPTRRLIVEMHVHGAMTFGAGFAVWQACQASNREQRCYSKAIETVRAQLT